MDFGIEAVSAPEIPKKTLPKLLCPCKSNPDYNLDSSVFDGLECLSDNSNNTNTNNNISDECIAKLSNL